MSFTYQSAQPSHLGNLGCPRSSRKLLNEQNPSCMSLNVYPAPLLTNNSKMTNHVTETTTQKVSQESNSTKIRKIGVKKAIWVGKQQLIPCLTQKQHKFETQQASEVEQSQISQQILVRTVSEETLAKSNHFFFNLSISVCNYMVLSSLRSIQLLYCNIQSLRELGSGWSTLKSLTVFCCGLQDLSGISGMQSLKQLRVPFNRLSHLSDLMYHPQLKLIDLSDNNLTTLEGAYIDTLTQLRQLDLSGNELQVDVVTGISKSLGNCRVVFEKRISVALEVAQSRKLGQYSELKDFPEFVNEHLALNYQNEFSESQMKATDNTNGNQNQAPLSQQVADVLSQYLCSKLPRNLSKQSTKFSGIANQQVKSLIKEHQLSSSISKQKPMDLNQPVNVSYIQSLSYPCNQVSFIRDLAPLQKHHKKSLAKIHLASLTATHIASEGDTDVSNVENLSSTNSNDLDCLNRMKSTKLLLAPIKAVNRLSSMKIQ